MRVYLSGVEYYSYRNIMRKCNVQFGSLNYAYIWARTPRFHLDEETDFLEELIVEPGNLDPTHVEDYVNFLNAYSDSITFAIELYSKDREMLDMDCKVEIIPWFDALEAPMVAVSHTGLQKPFVEQKLKRAYGRGIKIHGVNCRREYFKSTHDGTWMRGKAGIISYFTPKNKMEICDGAHERANIGRKLKVEGHKLNLDLIKRNDWKELALMNCISWKKYQDYMEEQ